MAARALQEQLGGIQDLLVMDDELQRITSTLQDAPRLSAEISSLRHALKSMLKMAREDFVRGLRSGHLT